MYHENLFLLLLYSRYRSYKVVETCKLSDPRVYEPQIQARLGTTAYFCRVVVLDSMELTLGEVGFKPFA